MTARAKAARLAAATLLVAALPREAHAAPRVWATDDAERLRRGDTASPLSRGEDNPIWQPGGPIRLTALRDEVVAFQVVVEAADKPLRGVTVELERLAPTKPRAAPEPIVERFVEHYVAVTKRSSDGKFPRSSLGWSPRSRPDDRRMLGEVPDALVPIELAPSWCPYPLEVPARKLGAVWVDVRVPRTARAGEYDGEVVVRGPGLSPSRIPVTLTVVDAAMPYRATSFIAYYAPGELAERTGDGPATERDLWQLLHAHHVDALASLNSPDDAKRLRPALDGSWFLPEAGYAGPGEGRAPLAVALGAYGNFGEPSPKAMDNVRAIVPLIPVGVRDVVLYASDEDCESMTGRNWRAALRHERDLARVRVTQSCAKDPAGQGVDVVLVPADHFRSDDADRARDVGKHVWTYNGALPHSGTLLLDADPSGLVADGWIAASRGAERWFLWETTFWNDDNSGGKGPIDPFATPESFHNKHGDMALGDGMLLYPGTQIRYPAHSLGRLGVVASMRLKALRRGIQDAGYLALARSADPAAADRIVDGLVPGALDEVRDRDKTTWPAGGAGFAKARDALRALVKKGTRLEPDQTAAVLEEGIAARRVARAERRRLVLFGGAGAGLFVLVGIGVFWRRRARRVERLVRSVGSTRPEAAARWR